MDKVWTEVKPLYLEEMQKYNYDKMEEQLQFLWDYLRMERTDTFIFVIIPNLLDMHWSGTWSTYENYGYIVEHRQVHNFNAHEYLHSIINPLIEKHYGRQRRKLTKYYQAEKKLPYAQSYQDPKAYAWESFVRALDLRLHVLQENDPETTKRCEDRVEYLSKEGLGLVRPFYLLLKEYELTDGSLDHFIPIMLEKVPEYPG